MGKLVWSSKAGVTRDRSGRFFIEPRWGVFALYDGNHREAGGVAVDSIKEGKRLAEKIARRPS